MTAAAPLSVGGAVRAVLRERGSALGFYWGLPSPLAGAFMIKSTAFLG